jgi:hypothetical protein
MTYPIVDTPPLPSRKWKYSAIVQLEIGQGFMVPYSDLSTIGDDPTHTVRTIAWDYSKKLG